MIFVNPRSERTFFTTSVSFPMKYLYPSKIDICVDGYNSSDVSDTLSDTISPDGSLGSAGISCDAGSSGPYVIFGISPSPDI